MVNEVKAYEAEGAIYATFEEAKRMEDATSFAYALEPHFTGGDILDLSTKLSLMRELRSVGLAMFEQNPTMARKIIAAIGAVDKS